MTIECGSTRLGRWSGSNSNDYKGALPRGWSPSVQVGIACRLGQREQQESAFLSVHGGRG
jgi:hypothetical protein